jgi:hypothetical protein
MYFERPFLTLTLVNHTSVDRNAALHVQLWANLFCRDGYNTSTPHNPAGMLTATGVIKRVVSHRPVSLKLNLSL